MPVRPRFSTFLDPATPIRHLKPKPFVVGDIPLSDSEFDVSHQYATGEYLETNAGRTASTETQQPAEPATPPTADELRKASLAQLNRYRRQFALVNHPDMLPERERNAATTKMATINRLIDDEIARRRQSNEPF